jgi:glycosyltransferase involved in cell wall biosynthesis
LKVIHVIPSVAARTGGTAYMALHLARALQAHGLEAPVFSTDQAAPAQLGPRAGRVDLQLPPVAGDYDLRLFPVERVHRLAYAPSLREALQIEARTSDLIHVHTLFLYPTYAGYRAAVGARKPVVVSPHGSLDPWIRERGRLRKLATHLAWQRRLFRQTAALHATTAEEHALWPKYARRRPHFVVPAGIELAEFRNLPDGGAFRRELGIGDDEPLIVNLGRVARKKGIDILVQATARLHRAGLPAHVAVVGPDDENLTPALACLAEREQIGSFVHFTGFREGHAKLEALAAATVWALPSHTENFGIAVVEALAAGCPVLVSTEVNLAPRIAAAGAGLVVAPTVEASAEGLRTLLADDALRLRVATAGRALAARFDWSEIGARMLDAYRAVLDER